MEGGRYRGTLRYSLSLSVVLLELTVPIEDYVTIAEDIKTSRAHI